MTTVTVEIECIPDGLWWWWWWWCYSSSSSSSSSTVSLILIHPVIDRDADFLNLLGVIFIGVTTTILLAVPEEPDQDPADQSSVLATYQNVICISCLPAVRTLLICLITFKVYATTTTTMKKAFRETQTLRAGCSKAEPKIFALPQTPFRGHRIAKFHQLEMVTTCIHRPSLVTIDARNFELS